MRWLTALILVTSATACSELASVDRSKIPVMTNTPGSAGMSSDNSADSDQSNDDAANDAGSARPAADTDDAGASDSDGGA
jgi:hypothetical protein